MESVALVELLILHTLNAESKAALQLNNDKEKGKDGNKRKLFFFKFSQSRKKKRMPRNEIIFMA